MQCLCTWGGVHVHVCPLAKHILYNKSICLRCFSTFVCIILPPPFTFCLFKPHNISLIWKCGCSHSLPLSVSFDKQICRHCLRITTSFDSQLTVNSQSQGSLHYINGKLDYFFSQETELSLDSAVDSEIRTSNHVLNSLGDI